MLSLITALLLLCDLETENPVGLILLHLFRHQNDDGAWQAPPANCYCRCPRPAAGRVPLVPDPETLRRFQSLTRTLGSDSVSEREAAQKDLYGLGIPAIPLLQDASTDPDPEVRWRCRETLDKHWRRNPIVQDLIRKAAYPDTLDFGLKATSLALLAFLGAGYSPLSRDEKN